MALLMQMEIPLTSICPEERFKKKKHRKCFQKLRKEKMLVIYQA